VNGRNKQFIRHIAVPVFAAFGFGCVAALIVPGMLSGGARESCAASPEDWVCGDGEGVKAYQNGALKAPPRSCKWAAFRDAYAKGHPVCIFCCKPVENIHHIAPFHNDTAEELSENNVCPLCRRCHFEWGHLENWKSWNTNILKHAEWYRGLVKTRPVKERAKK